MGVGVIFAVFVAGMIVAAFFSPPLVSAVLVSTAILMTVTAFWGFRPSRTLLTEEGVVSATVVAKWEEITYWELYGDGKVLTLSTRSELLRVDALMVEVPIFANSGAAAVVLGERVPNGRVLP